MQDQKAILYRGYAYTKYEHPGPTDTAVAAQANPTQAAGNTGFIDLKNVSRIPYGGMDLEITLPGPFATSGTTGTSTLVFTTTHSDDGTNTLASVGHVSRGIIFTAATGSVATITTPTTTTGLTQYVLVWRLPEIRHRYIKVSWASILATITTIDYGAMTIALVQQPDSEPNNSVEIG